MNPAEWGLETGHAVEAGGLVAFHHRAHYLVEGKSQPGVIGGIEWARLVESVETWIGAPPNPDALVPPPAEPEARRYVPDISGWPAEQLAGGAFDELEKGTGIAEASGGACHARYTWYRPGVHDLALTGEECDYLLRCAGPFWHSTWRDDLSGVTGVAQYGRRRWIIERISTAVSIANAVWWHYEIPTYDACQVLRYRPGDFNAAHTDWSPRFPARKLSVVALLSDPDDYEGGTLEFLHDVAPTSPPLERGIIVVFPATLLHRVTPVTAGERYSLTAFYTGPGGP